MAGRALLDTSAAAALLRGDAALGGVFADLTELYTSAIVVGELIYGARLSENTEANQGQVAASATAFTVLPVDELTAQIYARLKQSLRSKGRPIPDNDLWIASTAVQHGLSLLHRDAHFDETDEVERLSW